MSKMDYVPALIAAVLFGAVIGCGGEGYEGPKRAEVKGNVTFGGEPVAQGTLNLIPVGHEGNKVSVPITNGAYEIPEARGPNAGKHRVEIYSFKPSAAPAGAEGDADAASATQQVIPPKYNTESTQEVEIVDGENRHDFDLTP